MSNASGKPKVLIITQYSLPSYKKNMNAYQRNYYGSEYADITLLVRKRQEISEELHERIRVKRSPFENRWLYLVYAVIYSGYLRLKGMKVFITEPTGMAAAGFLSKFLFGTTWVLDLWDRPQWRPGQHQSDASKSLFDRTVFWIMRHADLYILSCMRDAVKDINPPERRCAYFPNAIDPTLFEESIPKREVGEPLQISFGKSIFDDTVGLSVVVEAAELLASRGCEFTIHIIGDVVSDAPRNLVEQSSAARNIVLHGVIKESRASFFRRIHVGVVPYMDFEDLRYIFPIKVLEHLCQGNPVIASDLPGLATMIQNEYNGLLVRPNDSIALADAIERLCRDYDAWKNMARNALLSIKNFDAYEKNKSIFNTILLEYVSNAP